MCWAKKKKVFSITISGSVRTINPESFLKFLQSDFVKRNPNMMLMH